MLTILKKSMKAAFAQLRSLWEEVQWYDDRGRLDIDTRCFQSHSDHSGVIVLPHRARLFLEEYLALTHPSSILIDTTREGCWEYNASEAQPTMLESQKIASPRDESTHSTQSDEDQSNGESPPGHDQ